MSETAPAGSTRRLALLLEYDGTCYGGSQFQQNAPSIQGELEAAVTRLTGDRTRVALAGRTDAGVHATGQVAALSTQSRHLPQTFVRALNHWLPADIAVRAAVEAPAGFDPRRDALSRTYRYLVVDGRPRSPLWQGRAWEFERRLDVAAMARAASLLPGRHDLAAFAGAPGAPGASTLRQVFRAEVTRRGTCVVVEMEADAFLPHQVRRTVGLLVEIGLGRQEPSLVQRCLDRPDERPATQTAPACGLYLVGVRYEDVDFGPAVPDDGLEAMLQVMM